MATTLLLCFLSLISICRAQGSSEDLPWFVWLILGLGLAVGLVLIGLTVFYVLNVCKKVFGNRSSVYHEGYQETQQLQQANSKEHPPPPAEKAEAPVLEANPNASATSLRSIEPHEKEIQREKIKILQQLGIGEYGPIYDAEVELDINIKSRALVKVFQKGTSQDLAVYKHELEKLMRLNHSNVTRLFGVVSQSPYYTIIELPVNGDLKTFLLTSKASHTNITITQLLAMATDAARGLAYMESIQYIHQDIAARNCVVTQSLGIKISDYKVSRFLFRSEYAVQADGSLMPLRWMAPESLMENHISLQSDIWSFGTLLWELFTTGQFPFAELSDAEVVQGVCYEFTRLLKPISCPNEIYQLMLKCWHSNPSQRPKMDYLRQQLETCILLVPTKPTTIEAEVEEEAPFPPLSDPGIPAHLLST
ncbi:PREDICTED: tyrosine-protein kinase SRK2-like [Amphimedon queenslandica]|uniref:Protein kinase domain-containing protein n=1 Tax=Amphimedon queenslandica TaxID=400682 RepID=A0A1X7VFJ6_AMPQE|nr:PREDICTED: tyrosine-protein kinase SRK2-like [Amphimedon queenslandica]|eukprot:XP_019849095.1 PREDICTED: tyrosine-protein kinase SRK2-like [Amphimedon queenslandica]